MLSAVLLTLGLVAAAVAPGPANAGPHIVFDLNSDRVYDQKQAFDRWYPASLNKIMTAYVVFKEIKSGRISKTSPVRISPFAQSKPPSKMGFPVGTILTVDAALKIILVKSANDVTTALAESVAGSEAAFVQLMNRYAAQLGMENTRYANPHGLPDDTQYTNARDLAVLTRAVYDEFPREAGYFAIEAIKVGKNTLKNHNKLLHQFPGTIGMKTGFICSAGLNLVAVAKMRGRTLAAVVLGGSTGRERNLTAAQLLVNASKKTFAFGLPKLDSLRAKGAIMPPYDMRAEVCGRKRSERIVSAVDEDEAVNVFAIRQPTLDEIEEQYFKPVGQLRVTTVELGNASGPDPFGFVKPLPETEMAAIKQSETAANVMAFAGDSGSAAIFETSPVTGTTGSLETPVYTLSDGLRVAVPVPRPSF